MSKNRAIALKGFTIVELAIAIGIIAVLSTVGLVSYSGLQQNNRNQIRSRNLTELKQSLELYRHDKHHYPTTINGLLTDNYSNAIPTDPTPATRAYFYRAFDNNNAACSATGNDCAKYVLCAATEGSQSYGDPGSCSANNCGTVRCNMSIINE